MKRTSQITKALLGGLIVFLISTLPAIAMVVEFFDHVSFVDSAGSLTTIDLDALAACNNCLAGNEFTAQGLTIVQRDGYGINVVQNLVPGGFGANFVTEANINSPPNVISSTIFVTSATAALTDNYDFVFTNPVTTAGLFIGNLGGGCCPLVPTTVEFLTAFDGVIASEVLTKDHLGVIFGATGETWDNRIFYGIISDTPIKRIRVTNGPDDGDAITFDDIQFSVVSQTCVQPPAGLVSWWPGDGDANDIADRNNGTLQNGATFAAGFVGQAFSLDGLDDFIRVSDAANLRITGEITLDAWVFIKQYPSVGPGFVSKGNFGNFVESYVIGIEPAGTFAFVLNRDGTPGGRTLVRGPVIPLNTWTHVAGTYDGTTMHIYTNGIEVGSASHGGGIFVVPDPVLIGTADRTGTGFPATFVNGLIDEVEIYNRALAGEEIQAIFNAGSAGKCKVNSVPFAAFDAKVEIDDDEFEVKATFTVGAGSDGIDIPTEMVSLQLSGGSGSFSITIPAGAFTQDEKGRFKFEGVIDGVFLEAKITPLGGDTFEFKAEAEGTDLTGLANAVTVSLAVGDDGGSTTVEAEFE